jgi:hypothetical protein
MSRNTRVKKSLIPQGLPQIKLISHHSSRITTITIRKVRKISMISPNCLSQTGKIRFYTLPAREMSSLLL